MSLSAPVSKSEDSPLNLFMFCPNAGFDLHTEMKQRRFGRSASALCFCGLTLWSINNIVEDRVFKRRDGLICRLRRRLKKKRRKKRCGGT